MDKVRTECYQSKVPAKNKNLRDEISSMDLIITILSKSLSQITNSFNVCNSIRSQRSIDKIVGKEKLELSGKRRL